MQRLANWLGLRSCCRITSAVALGMMLLSLLGCKDEYREHSEPMYEALVQLRDDARSNVRTHTFAVHLTAADRTHEKWAHRVCHLAARRKSARTLDDILQMYGKVGTLRMMEGAPTVACHSTDRETFDQAEQALAFVRQDLDAG